MATSRPSKQGHAWYVTEACTSYRNIQSRDTVVDPIASTNDTPPPNAVHPSRGYVAHVCGKSNLFPCEPDNPAIRYDFDVGGNGTFRLFPSGNNRYPRNSEVLNSYGRRANDNLLLEYGFAMLDNEWDTAEVTCSLPPSHDQY
ncbi:unnamed protein product, partial [Ectocarpus sp. 12 AP-2014]